MTEENKLYQLSVLFSPQIEQSKVGEIIEKIKQKITVQNGSLSGEKNLLKKDLSYPINNHQDAFFYTFNFSLLPNLINEIEKYLNSEKSIIRHMLTIRKVQKARPFKESVDLKMIDKIEPIKDQVVSEKEPGRKPAPRKEKVKIEELDKKLKEILEG
ncbi:MAG: 30S ribosomal protein S6 [Candidatus Portnoybacteria bacterium]